MSMKRHHSTEKMLLRKLPNTTLDRANGLKAFWMDGRIEIDNNPAENAICLSIAETAKACFRSSFSRYL